MRGGANEKSLTNYVVRIYPNGGDGCKGSNEGNVGIHRITYQNPPILKKMYDWG